MCRHLAYLGPPRPLAEFVLAAPHSLLRQSYAPRDMRQGGTVNADGFGVGWYPPDGGPDGGGPDGGGPGDGGPGDGGGGGSGGGGSGDGGPGDGGPGGPGGGPGGGPSGSGAVAAGGPGGVGPVRYRRSCPLWTDEGFAALAAVTSSGAVLAAVRSATVGSPVVETACAPFTDGRWLFSHNGRLPGWPASAVGLAAELGTADLLTLDAPIDSALLWALVRCRLARGTAPADAVAEVVRAASALPGARLNFLLTDGTVVVASTWWHSLSVRLDAGALTVSSEPTDDGPGWAAVPDRRLVVATRSTVEITPLEAS